MTNSVLLSPYKLGMHELKNRIVMSPLTRSRAIGNVPNRLMAEYYGLRAAAGLIVTEGTSPSPNGLGYCRIPGLFDQAQVEGWKLITSAVHSRGGKIFAQLMHTGRISHQDNLPKDAVVLAPSAVKAAGQIFTDTRGLLDYPVPRAMTLAEIESTCNEYVQASVNAMKAGFDGVEMHGANGYLLEQFLSPFSNRREDHYGGSVENRCRFVLEVVSGAIRATGRDNVGIRLSPYGVASDMHYYPEVDETYIYLAGKLNELGAVYIHLPDHSSMGAPEVPLSIKKAIRGKMERTMILCGGYTAERAEEDLKSGLADLVAFGRPFINNPDLVERITNHWPLSSELDSSTFYSPGEKGYTDYPAYLQK